jgi:molybdopterin-guanine dinucleotide biosynthesis protein A
LTGRSEGPPYYEFGVAILGGGAATRLPGKLVLDAGGEPMIARVYRNVGRGRETFVSCAGGFPAAVDAHLPLPMVVDRMPGRGPLGGLVTTLARMRSAWVFVVAGDAPFVDADLPAALAAARRPGDEAVVPESFIDGVARLEPLAALYERWAFLRAGVAALRAGSRSVRGVVERLNARRVLVRDARIFTNVNTPADYARLRLMDSPAASFATEELP